MRSFLLFVICTFVVVCFSLTASQTSSSAFSFQTPSALPEINSIYPSGSVLGRTVDVTIAGNNLSSDAIVSISGSGVSVVTKTSNSNTVTATFTIDPNATTGTRTVRVTKPSGNSATINFTIGDPTPVVTNFTPSTSQTGTTISVNINGTGFGANPFIQVNGTGVNASVTSSSNTYIAANFTISSGAAPGNYPVTVVSRGANGAGFVSVNGSSPNSSYVYLNVTNPPMPVPQITNISPLSGQTGINVPVTIYGNNFGTSPSIQVSGGGITASVTSASSTQINANFSITSGAAVGTRTVTVFANGTSSNGVSFSVIEGTIAPQITSISPSSGQAGINVPVTIYGNNFGTSPSIQVSGGGITTA